MWHEDSSFDRFFVEKNYSIVPYLQMPYETESVISDKVVHQNTNTDHNQHEHFTLVGEMEVFC